MFRWVVGSFAMVVLAVGCAASVSTVVSLQDIDCVSCGGSIVKDLEETPGVKAARFDRKTAEVTIEHDPKAVSAAALLAKVEAWGWPAVLGAGQGHYLAPVEFPATADVAWLTREGAAVELAKAPVPGKVTVVDFGASWCRPCRAADAFLLEQLAARPGLAVRKVDVVDWDSPVALQQLRAVKELPYFIVFDAKGAERARLGGFEPAQLGAALDEASQ